MVYETIVAAHNSTGLNGTYQAATQAAPNILGKTFE